MKVCHIVCSATLVCGLASPFILSSSLAATAPPLSLAQVYQDEVDLSRYWVSEKLDGARVWWDGKQLLSRNGNVYHAPDWFTDGLPDRVLDGELWIGRGQFQQLMQTIRDTIPDHDAWRKVRFFAFDAPLVQGSFTQRQEHLISMVANQSSPWLQHVEQQRIPDTVKLQEWLARVVSDGGEGLILQRGDLAYRAGRHAGMLKLKTFEDAEARVIGYVPGRGKYSGMTGSLLVIDESGLTFRLGSGLTDAERLTPPAIGDLVSYRFQGRTRSGKPRFARFLRIRPTE